MTGSGDRESGQHRGLYERGWNGSGLGAVALSACIASFAGSGRDKKPARHPAKTGAKANDAKTEKDAKEATVGGAIIINGTALSAAEIQAIEKQYGVQLVPGKYWYDKNCGAWGIEGGATVGWVMPGLSVGGPLRANASGGNTNVFINGRELHTLDVAGLQQLLNVLPGRYWVDSRWNCGYEGGPALFNLALLISARSGGNQGGAWSSTTKHFTNNTTVGGDGGSFMYVSGKDSHGKRYTYFP